MDLKPVSLQSLGSGAANELFSQELAKVVGNIIDPNTEAEAKRSITIKVTLAPTPERDAAIVRISASATLAPFRAAASRLFVGKKDGKPVAAEFDPRQLGMDFDGDEEPGGEDPERSLAVLEGGGPKP